MINVVARYKPSAHYWELGWIDGDGEFISQLGNFGSRKEAEATLPRVQEQIRQKEVLLGTVDLSKCRFPSTILFSEEDTSIHLRLVPDFQKLTLVIWVITEGGGASVTYKLSEVPKNGTTLDLGQL